MESGLSSSRRGGTRPPGRLELLAIISLIRGLVNTPVQPRRGCVHAQGQRCCSPKSAAEWHRPPLPPVTLSVSEESKLPPDQSAAESPRPAQPQPPQRLRCSSFPRVRGNQKGASPACGESEGGFPSVRGIRRGRAQHDSEARGQWLRSGVVGREFRCFAWGRSVATPLT